MRLRRSAPDLYIDVYRYIRLTSIDIQRAEPGITTTDEYRGKLMSTSTAAEKLAEPEKKEEKAEKRRALGRGLESLLPGPRVVSML